MRVGLVARFLGEPIGLGTYAVNLLQALDRRQDEHEYFVYTPTWNDVPSLGPRFQVRRSYALRGSRAALTLWDQTLPALAAARERLDLVHYLHPAGPPISPGCPVVVNLLDAIRWVVPGYRLPYPYDWLERRAVRRADLILTLSESARGDIERVLGISRTKIRVTYLGGPPLDPEPSSKEPYFLFVGGTEKRKNLAAVLDAFKTVQGFELRVVGRHKASPVHDARREQSGVRWLGYIGEEQLVELYRHATALVFPSRYEGFGLPVLEAMARRTPVIASTGSSIPEVARGAAMLVDPDDVDALRDAMRGVATDASLREEMVRRGAEVVSSFSWEETARSTVAAYEELRTGGSGSKHAAAAGTRGEEQIELDVLDTPEAGGLIIRGGAMRLFGYVATIALSILSTALVTRHLQPVGFSHYTTILSLVGAVAIVTDAGMSSLGTQGYAVRSGADRDQLMSDLLGLRMALTTVGVLGSLAFALAAGYDAELLLATLVAGVATIGLVFQHTLSIPLMATLRLGTVSILDLARQVLTVGGIVALVLVGAGVLPLLTATLVANLLLIPLTALSVRYRISMRLEIDLRRWLALLRLTVSFSLATAVGAIYVYAAQILTSLVTSPQQSGLFAAPFRVFVVTITIPGLLVGGALPMLARAARDDRTRLAYALQRVFEVSLIIGLAAVLATLVGAGFIIAVVAGPSFAASAPVLRILGLAMLGSFLNAGWGYALISSKRYRGLLAANGSALAVSVALTLVLASLDGARGTAVATLCGEVTLALGVLIALIRGHPEYRPRLLVVPKAALAFAVALALPLVLGLSSFEALLVALGVYAVLIALLRAIPTEVLEMIPRPGALLSRTPPTG